MFPDKKESFFITFGLLFVQFVIALILTLAGITWENSSPGFYIFFAVSSCIVVVGFCLPRMGLRFSQLFHAGINSVYQLIPATLVPVALVVVGCHVLLSNFFFFYYYFFPQQTSLSENLNDLLAGGFLGFIAICIVPPIVEEIIFRGIILRGLLSHYTPQQALLTSSILFSLIHLNPDQLFHTLVIGYFFGWLYIRSYSLWPSIIAHGVFNLVAFSLGNAYVLIEGVNYFPDEQWVLPSIFVQVPALLAVCLGLSLLRRYFRGTATAP